MDFGGTNERKRDEWEFSYSSLTLAKGAKNQREFRQSRVVFWKEAYAKVMQEVKDKGLEVSESEAMRTANYGSTQVMGPRLVIQEDLQRKLSEAHNKIQTHEKAVAEYDAWVQLLSETPVQELKLTINDWLFFFGKI